MKPTVSGKPLPTSPQMLKVNYLMYVYACVEGTFKHSLFNQILDEDGFVGDLRTQSSDVQESIDQYDTPRLVKTNQSRHCWLSMITTVMLSALCYAH